MPDHASPSPAPGTPNPAPAGPALPDRPLISANHADLVRAALIVVVTPDAEMTAGALDGMAQSLKGELEARRLPEAVTA